MLEKRIIENVIEMGLGQGADFVELYIERERKTNISMLNEALDAIQSGIDFGLGIRLFFGLQSVYGFTNDMQEENILRLTKELCEPFQKKAFVLPKLMIGKKVPCINPIIIQPNTIEKKKKIQTLYDMSQSARGYHSMVTQTKAHYFDTIKEVCIVNSEGTWAEEERVRTRLTIEAIATNKNEKQTGRESHGSSQGFELVDTLDLEAMGKEAGQTACTMVEARPCPKGEMPVLVGNGFGGVIFHEACGHGLEATALAKKATVFADKLGKKIASSVVTAIDDSTIENAWGSTSIDDEGEQTKKRVLIENGILKSYMIDGFNGRRLNMASTASSRRESYQYAPTSRMSNTYIANGESSFHEMLCSIDSGLYAKKMGGGSVNPATGEFNFVVLEGYLIEKGEIKEPLQGATLIGKGSEVLEKIEMVGDNLEHAQGMCGSSSGSVPTNVGQPALKVSSMVVGGKG